MQDGGDYTDELSIKVNLYIEILCKELAYFGIKHDIEWIPADNLLVLFFFDHENNVQACAFHIFGYYSPLLLVNSGTLGLDRGYVSTDEILISIKNKYCSLGKKK